MKTLLIAAFLAVGTVNPALASAKTEIVVHKSPTCGCCTKWEDHLRAAGFKVVSKQVDDLNKIKTQAGVPDALQSCHTAKVQGYVIEGHVPAASIKKLLAKKPKSVKGLAVPGMPMGSPGMEGPYTEKYEVISFEKGGKTEVFDKY